MEKNQQKAPLRGIRLVIKQKSKEVNFVRLEKLSNQFYEANLLYGKIGLKPTHTWSFYYVVENTADKEFIEKEALKTVLFVNEHSREFHFY